MAIKETMKEVFNKALTSGKQNAKKPLVKNITKSIKKAYATVKTKALTVGTPPEKEVLYKEVIKRKIPKESAEKIVINEIKDSLKKVFTSPKDESVDFSRGTPPPPVKKAKKKKSTSKKTTVKKSTVKSKTSTASTKKTATKTTSTKKASTSTQTKKNTPKKDVEAKDVTTSKKATINTKKTSTSKPKKTTPKQKVSKRDEKIALYIKDIKKHYGEVDEDFVAIITKNLGPSIYRKDAELVSCSEPKELDVVRRNFLIKKLGLTEDKAVLNAAIETVCQELKGVRRKYRATFYYRLAKQFKKESVLR